MPTFDCCPFAGTLDLIDEFFISFDQKDPGLLVRASLYRMVFQDGKVLNRLTMDTLVSHAPAQPDRNRRA